MDLSRFFIDRPIFASVVSIFIFIAGLLAMFRLPVSEYPEVVPPSVQVRTQFPGANPQVLRVMDRSISGWKVSHHDAVHFVPLKSGTL